MDKKVAVQSTEWGNQVCKGLKELYDEHIGCNVAIYGSKGGIIDAHACVLMAVSPTLKTWLAGDPIQGCHSVEIDTITTDTWKHLLEFIYTGKVEADKESITNMVGASEKLSMDVLTNACKNALKCEEDEITPDNHSPPFHENPTSLPPKVNGFHEERAAAVITNDKPVIEGSSIKKENDFDDVPFDLSKSKQKGNSNGPGKAALSASTEQPLDLTKVEPKQNDKAKPEKFELSSPPDEHPLLGLPPLPLFPPNTDPHMKAVINVYYNQMMQYNMLTQNMKAMQNNNAFGNLSPPSQLPPNLQIPTPQGRMSTVTQAPASAGSNCAEFSRLPMVPPPFLHTPQTELSLQDGRQRKFPCSMCGMLFYTRHVKEQHELTHTNLKPYSCNICGFRARQKAVIWRHKKNRHPEADSSVSMDVLTTDMAPLSPEEEDDDPPSPSDYSDGKNSPSPENMSQSQETSPPASSATLASFSSMNTSFDTPSLTQITPPNFNSISTPRSAKTFIQSDPRKPYVCKVCGRGFKNKYILSQHSMIHSDERRYSCDICGFRAKQMSVIYNHRRNKHSDRRPAIGHYQHSSTPRPEAMTFGNMSSNTAITPPGESTLPENIMNHDGNLKNIELIVQNAARTPLGYLCTICGRSLKTKMILQEHMMTHFNIRRYSCNYCSYRAKQRAGLYNHIKVKHRDLRPMRPLVQKSLASFTSAGSSPSLQHNPFTPGRRKYKCRTCAKAFRIKHVLQQHELIHLNVKRYSCKFCGLKAKLKSVIYKHNRLVHFGKKAEVVDLLKSKLCRIPKVVPRMPKFNTTPKSNEQTKAQELFQRHAEINDKLSRQPVEFKPIATKPVEDVQDLSAIANKLKSQIVPQQTQQFPPVANFTPQVMGSNLVFAMALNRQQQQQSHTAPVTISPPSPDSASNTACENPPAKYPTYGTPDKPHRCKYCGRCFRLRHVMEQHELTHSSFRKYMCDICGFRAKQKAVIYRHKKVKHKHEPGPGRVTVVTEVQNDQERDVDTPTQVRNPSPSDCPPQLVPVNQQRPLPPPDMAALTNTAAGMAVIPKSFLLGLHNSDATKIMENNFQQRQNEISPPSSQMISPPSFNLTSPFHSTVAASSTASATGWNVNIPTPLEDDDEDDEEEEMPDFPTGLSLTTNMALGLPSMVPSSTAINASLVPMPPLSPEQHSPTDEVGNKKYICHICNRSFKHRHVLEQHHITHTHLRPYKCEFCDFRARQKASLWRHKQKHLVGMAIVPPPQ